MPCVHTLSYLEKPSCVHSMPCVHTPSYLVALPCTFHALCPYPIISRSPPVCIPCPVSKPHQISYRQTPSSNPIISRIISCSPPVCIPCPIISWKALLWAFHALLRAMPCVHSTPATSHAEAASYPPTHHALTQALLFCADMPYVLVPYSLFYPCPVTSHAEAASYPPNTPCPNTNTLVLCWYATRFGALQPNLPMPC